MKSEISVMITTRNRLAELQRTLEVLQTLDPAPSEILVTADGCTDGTVEFLEAWSSGRAAAVSGEEWRVAGEGPDGGVKSEELGVAGGAKDEGLKGQRDGGERISDVGDRRSEDNEQMSECRRRISENRGQGPDAGGTVRRVFVNETGMGSVASRDRMMRAARGDLVLALDDDSYPEQKDCVAALRNLFFNNPRLAVASFPQRTDEYPETLTQTDFGPERPVRSFASSGACLRVSTYRALPGFEPMFFHMYEEPDYCLQCIGKGWEVRFCSHVTIRHHWTGSGRSEMRNHHLHARNELWSTIMRCPMPQALPMVIYRVVSQARYAAKRGPVWILQEPVWWWQALCGVAAASKRRCPVSWEGYLAWMERR